MKKHWKKALFLFLALILLLSVPAAAKTVRKGWRTENGTTYYYKNGRAVKGIRTIGKKTYFFEQDKKRDSLCRFACLLREGGIPASVF